MRLPVTCLLALALSACGNPSVPAESSAPASSTDAIADVGIAFDHLVNVSNAGDLDAVMELLADDFVQIQPETAIVGKPAAREAWGTFFDTYTDVWSPTVLNVQVSDNLGFVTSTFEETSTPIAGGDPITTHGNSVAIFRRGDGDHWLEVLDQWFYLDRIPQPSTDPPPTSTAGSISEVRATFDGLVDAWNAGDLEIFMAGVADDFVQMSPNRTIVGKADIEASWRAYAAENLDIWTPTILNVQTAGDLGFVTHTFTETATPKAGGEPSSQMGRGLVVFQRDGSGRWMEVLDQWFEN